MHLIFTVFFLIQFQSSHISIYIYIYIYIKKKKIFQILLIILNSMIMPAVLGQGRAHVVTTPPI
jgi:hypothetical protein